MPVEDATVVEPENSESVVTEPDEIIPPVPETEPITQVPDESMVIENIITADSIPAAAAQPVSAPPAPVPLQNSDSFSAISSPAVNSQQLAAIEQSPQIPEPASVRQEESVPSKPQVLTKSIEQLMAENTPSVAKETVWDDSLFDDAIENTSKPASSSVQSASSAVSSLEGAAASAADSGANTGTTAVSAGQIRETSNSPVSEETKQALERIASTVYTQTGTLAGISHETVFDGAVSGAEGGTGSVSVMLADGSGRVLLDPVKPVITISAENEALIDSSKNVVIVFTILRSGSVPLNSIEIQPASLLPLPVQAEIRTQISRWRFAPAKSDGQARFKYSINKK
jgi:hypothetical protein